MRHLGEELNVGQAFDASPNAYIVLTPDLRIAGMNRAYLDVTGRDRDDLIGRDMFEAFDGGGGDAGAESVRQLRASMERVLETGERDHLALIEYRVEMGPGGEQERRFWSATHAPITDDAGRIRFILQHTSDVTDLARLGDTTTPEPPRNGTAIDAIVGGRVLERAKKVQAQAEALADERVRLISLFTQAPGFMAVLGGPDHVFEMVNPAYRRLVGDRDVVGLPIRDALPELENQPFYELLDNVFATGEPFEGREMKVELQHTPQGSPESLFLNFVYQPIRDAAGKVVGIFVQGHDATQTVEASRHQKLMIDELNHRVKNTLATVQSIAVQTARSHPDPIEFARSFQARIVALSHTHNLLTRSHWQGSDIRSVFDHEASAHGPSRVSLNGPHVELRPAAALSLGMIAHELATNSVKYGALSSGEGRVDVDWRFDPRDGRITLTWREVGGPAVQEPERLGFGSRLIQRNARHDLAGEARLRYPPEGFVAEIAFPQDHDAPNLELAR
ncbi:sensor histidine kinase [Brevundimonas sp.]|uniref:sensor histidine kinase n=1 Tax=Brevundimonas sp. TaxID=1871086 RepID=UPI0035AEF8B4